MTTTERNYPHAMLREIFEQPQAIAQTLAAYADGNSLREDVFSAARQALVGRDSILISASGSSRHAGLAGEILFEDLAGIAVDAEYASEYIYRSTHAGTERAVPATKSFTTQLVVLELLALYAARIRGRMTRAVVESHLAHLYAVPAALEAALPRWEKQVSKLSDSLQTAETFLFLGRGVHYPIAREGALKLKESAYIQAEGYPTGELKHGPNALVSRHNPLIVLATCDANAPDSVLRYEKTFNLVRDMNKQGADIISIVNEGDTRIAELSRVAIEVPAVAEYISPLYEVVPLQLLAYFMAIARHIDVDNPRNLVKAVVQE